ncbi:tau-tubulin kinase 2 [Anaeramoeba flamelloides]|uniref:non-specific serine/threonine protein kinase n=1 Tax=Anaeramoeba flamelloides TaxID=1746091 RepID=A0ABQ8X662_9EUKA|nr:tau-tubulin kinase 2 [Anaeramoeba flamelloides]
MLTGSIRGRWHLVTRIGQGGFGEIYIAHDRQTEQPVAIKFEKKSCQKEALKFEIEVLSQLQSSIFFPNFICSGCSKDFNYLVMDLHGPNLSSVRRHHRKRCFSITTTAKIGIEMILSIKEIHKIGFIHRDIKPSNFVLHRETTIKKLISKKKTKNDNLPTICLLDFGLARRYLDEERNLLQSRGKVGFRGTTRYASLNSHLGIDLSRRDDIWSLLYLLVEFLKGELPWSQIKDRQLIFELKKKFNSVSLVKGLSIQFAKFYEYVQTLKFEDSIDYDYLISLLQKAVKEGKYERDSSMDWDKSLFKKKMQSLSPFKLRHKQKQNPYKLPSTPKNYKKKNYLKQKKSRRIKYFLDSEYKQKYDKTVSDGPLDSKKAVPSLSISIKPSLSIYSKQIKPKVDKSLLLEINKMKDIPIPSYQESVWRRKMKENNENINEYELLNEGIYVNEKKQKRRKGKWKRKWNGTGKWKKRRKAKGKRKRKGKENGKGKQKLIKKWKKKGNKQIDRIRRITITTSSESISETTYDETAKSEITESSLKKLNNENTNIVKNDVKCNNKKKNQIKNKKNYKKKNNVNKNTLGSNNFGNKNKLIIKKETPMKRLNKKISTNSKTSGTEPKNLTLSETLSTESNLNSSKYIVADKKFCNCILM